MNPESIDRILASEEECLPSCGFLSAVMERVHAEAAEPQPLPFPWRRALPGILIALAVLGWSAVELIRFTAAALRGVSWAAALPKLDLPASLTGTMGQAGWLALALGASAVSWFVARRLIGRSGLL